HTLSVPQGSAPPYAPRAYAGQAFSTSYRYVVRGVPDCVRPSWPIPWRGGSRYDTRTGTDACQKSVTSRSISRTVCECVSGSGGTFTPCRYQFEAQFPNTTQSA